MQAGHAGLKEPEPRRIAAENVLQNHLHQKCERQAKTAQQGEAPMPVVTMARGEKHIIFGVLMDVTGIRSSAFMFMYGIVWVSLIWMYWTEVRRLEVMGKNAAGAQA